MSDPKLENISRRADSGVITKIVDRMEVKLKFYGKRTCYIGSLFRDIIYRYNLLSQVKVLKLARESLMAGHF